MIRKLFTLAAALIFATTANANPHPKLKKIVTALYIIGLPTAMATWNTIEVINCRKRNGPEKCETRYGSWKAVQVSTHLLTDLVLPIVTYKVKHIEEENGDFKTWYLLPLASSGASSYMAVNQRSKQPDRRNHCDGGKRFNGFGCE